SPYLLRSFGEYEADTESSGYSVIRSGLSYALNLIRNAGRQEEGKTYNSFLLLPAFLPSSEFSENRSGVRIIGQFQWAFTGIGRKYLLSLHLRLRRAICRSGAV